MDQEQSTSVSHANLLGATEQVAKILGVAAAGLLILSTAYDFSFLYSLGLSFEDCLTSIRFAG